jgi:two-component system, cell cycle response regulator
LGQLSQMRILIADDSIVSRHLLDATLRKWGYEVVVACDGNEAWNLLQEADAPRIAILDWVMPGLTGPEVCRRVRKMQQESDMYTYIVLLTSKSQREDLIEGMESGADDYLTKPFDQHELKVRLRPGTRIIQLQQELVAAREELREQATKDFLTRIWNRSSILDILERELIRGAREARPVGVVLADLDHFKTVNDTYGHFAGDAVLREFVRRVSGSIRTYDSIGRYGGEEFLIVLPGCDEAETRIYSERIREALALEPMFFNDESRLVTCSFGATACIPTSVTAQESLIRTADDALYEAKRKGRNMVIFRPFGHEQPPGEPVHEIQHALREHAGPADHTITEHIKEQRAANTKVQERDPNGMIN